MLSFYDDVALRQRTRAMLMIPLVVVFLSTTFISLSNTTPAEYSEDESHYVLDVGPKPGYDMGVTTSNAVVNWVTHHDSHMRIEYPKGQEWGSVFITVGSPRQPPRPGRDFSQYDRLSVELRGSKGGESVEIGIKDNQDPDNGSETKVLITDIPTTWRTYEFPLSDFRTADLHNLYVVTEFVFSGNAKTIDFLNIRYLSSAGSREKARMESFQVFSGRRLAVGYDMGVDTSGGITTWVARHEDHIRMAYPTGQQWGAVFITLGSPQGQPRPGRDFSQYDRLSVELRGSKGGESVEIGIKDNQDPDNGSETKVLITDIPTTWRTYEFPLSDFRTADLHNLYVVTEFVFSGKSQTIDLQSVSLLPKTKDEIRTKVLTYQVFSGRRLAIGYDMGVDTSGGITTWVARHEDHIRMAYPTGQQWGAVFITLGSPQGQPRPGRDFSQYDKLSVELRGSKGGESVEIGIKDNQDPDNGSETKVLITDIPTTWRTYEFPLSDFRTADLHNLYVVTEFVFGDEPRTVDFRNIEFVPSTSQYED